MISVQGLGKSFPGPDGTAVAAVNDVSFAAARGEIVALLGPNGAGKTTTMRMLATLVSPDTGTATVCGHDIRQDPVGVRRSIGYLSANTGLYGRLTAREMLTYIGRLQGVVDVRARVNALLEQFDIGRFAEVPCERLSTGMKQKVNIARALVHDPPVLVLDEPTAGLDVLVTEELMRFLTDARDHGRCVVYSTHILSEVERLCNRAVIIHRGRVLANGTLPEVEASAGVASFPDAFLTLIRAAS
ncbi:MAG: ABC transporter ATP-binding protein [Pseudomonadota bacterium]|nr:ABC transporter ATP-binding protein [Pseudomonadota bacterium]